MKKIKILTCIIMVLSIILTVSLPFMGATIGKLSYENYFAKEREFKDESIGYTHDYYIYYCDNWLFRQDIRDWKTTVLLKEKTTYVYPYKNVVYCVVNDSQIVTIDCNGNNKKLIYDAKIPIDVFFGNDDIFFFSSGNNIYRYHIASNTLELIVSEEHISFEPVSSDRILLHKENLLMHDPSVNDCCSESESQQITYEYVISQNQRTEYIYPEEEVVNDIQTRALPSSINGKAIPYIGTEGNYSTDKYYNIYNNIECPDAEHESQSSCKKYNRIISGIAQGERSQCYAFAEFIFDYIWFNNQNIQNKRYTYNFSLGSTESIRQNNFYKYVSSVPIGSHIRYQKGNGGYHSVIVTDLTSTNIGLYQANYAGNCRIEHGYRPIYNIIADSKSNARTMVLSDIYNHTHTSLSSQWLPNAATHVCIICGYAASHVGGSSCTVCGYPD